MKNENTKRSLPQTWKASLEKNIEDPQKKTLQAKRVLPFWFVYIILEP